MSRKHYTACGDTAQNNVLAKCQYIGDTAVRHILHAGALFLVVLLLSANEEKK